jgi:hypothetical protein
MFNVMDYGANPNDSCPDDQAIQAAINALENAPNDAGATDMPTVLCFPLPTVAPSATSNCPGGTDKGAVGAYLITHSLSITNRMNIHVVAPSRASLNHNGGTTLATRSALLKWFGTASTDATNPTPVLLFDTVENSTIDNISVDCGGQPTGYTVGLAFGANNGAASNAKYITANAVDANYCSIGIRLGNPPGNSSADAGSPDDSADIFVNSQVNYNDWAGVFVSSGNARVNFTSLSANNNGSRPVACNNSQLPVGCAQGANVFQVGGQLTLVSYMSAASVNTQPYPPCICSTLPCTCASRGADIVSNGNALNINGAESEVPGLFMLAANMTSESYIAGVRHFAPGMTTMNTAWSMEWGGPAALVLSGSRLFGSVVADSGNNAHVVDLGTQFETALNPSAGFIGAQVTAGAYFGAGGSSTIPSNLVGLTLNQPTNGVVSSYPFSHPLTVYSANLSGGLVRATTDNDYVLTEMLNSGGATGYSLLSNVYFDGANFRSIAANVPVAQFTLSGGPNPAMYFFGAPTPTAANQVVTFSTNAFSVTQVGTGGSVVYAAQFGTHTQAWYTAPPNAGTWTQGDIVYNSAAAAGQPMGWMCTGSSPLTWRAMPNL